MAESAGERAEAVQAVAEATSGSSAEVQRIAMQAVVPPPTQADADRLWFVLVVGLLMLAAISLAGLVFLLADGKEGTEHDAALTAFSSLITGLLGLFAPKPAMGGSKNSS